jgi:signal transduction histidine kinase/CheY-like chemotaxis protein
MPFERQLEEEHRDAASSFFAGKSPGRPVRALAPGMGPASWMARYVSGDDEPWYRRYGEALFAVFCAWLVREAFDPWMGDTAPYGMFIMATAVIAGRHGFGPGMATLATGALVATYFFTPPRFSLRFNDLQGVWPLIISFLIGMVTALVCELLRRLAIDNARLFYAARAADIRKDDFLAMLAHELRNPLAPIRNSLYILDVLPNKDPKIVDLHRIMSSQLDHLVRLVDDLLDVARITRGKIELRQEDTALEPIVTSAVAAARPLIEEKKHELQVSVGDRPIYLRGDAVRLTQVLTNLLNNAAKYTDKSGRIWLTAAAHPEKQLFTIRIRDTGVGLTPEQLQKVFGLFEQADASIEKTRGGLGIGLTLARKLVEMHGGTLEATSPGLGLGSEFIIRLPMSSSPAADALPKAASRPLAAANKSLRILVVEDVVASAESLAAMLRMWGHEVEVCYDGFTALQQVREFHPDVILSDLGLPQLNGYRLAEELRSMSTMGDVTLIAISGYGQARDRERSQRAGFTDHLTKPIDPEALRKALTDVAGNGTVGAPTG